MYFFLFKFQRWLPFWNILCVFHNKEFYLFVFNFPPKRYFWGIVDLIFLSILWLKKVNASRQNKFVKSFLKHSLVLLLTYMKKNKKFIAQTNFFFPKKCMQAFFWEMWYQQLFDFVMDSGLWQTPTILVITNINIVWHNLYSFYYGAKTYFWMTGWLKNVK